MTRHETTWAVTVIHMTETTNLQLDAPMSIPNALRLLRSRGLTVSRATVYRWDADRAATGDRPILRRPSGPRGRVYVVPADIEDHVRNRCSDETARNTVPA